MADMIEPSRLRQLATADIKTAEYALSGNWTMEKLELLVRVAPALIDYAKIMVRASEMIDTFPARLSECREHNPEELAAK